MNTLPAERDNNAIIEQVITKGDIGKLNAEERTNYYLSVCKSIGLNPMTRPLEYIHLNNKLILYARRDAADQLRKIHGISIEIVSRSVDGELFTVHVKAKDRTDRTDEDFGVVTLGTLKGEMRANAIMKCVTKAKRRVTLSISGLGFLDETEVEDIPNNGPQTLPKKDARDIYKRLQSEIDQIGSRDALKAWGAENADRIKVLPDDWQETLRLRYQERMVDLQNQEAKAPPKINGKMPNPTDSLQAWLLWLDEKLAGITSNIEALETCWNDSIAPIVDQLFPPDQEQAFVIYRRHEARLTE